ncbi:MAG: PAS domain S-box protein, partial [Magnetococcales bacterium]|nr:PAS domain S-box protein [Magnetococcales bacterium]
MSTTPRHILLIEDNRADVRLLQERLRGEPFELACFDRLESGLEHAATHSVDVVLLDLGLPDSHGIATLESALAQLPHLPIIVLTGLDDESNALEAMAHGAQDYLIKGSGDRRLIKRTIQYALERKRSEERLRESEERFRNISASAQEAIIVVNHEGIVILWNPAASRLFRFDEGEALGKPIIELIVPKRFHKPLAEGLRNFQKTGQGGLIGQTLELPARKKAGQEFPVEISLSAFRNKEQWNGMAVIRDITERKY